MSPGDLTHWISPSVLALEREKENVEQILENIKMKSAQTPMSLLGFRWKVQDHWPNLAVLWLAEAVSETEKTWPCKPMVQHNIHTPGPPALNKCTENPSLSTADAFGFGKPLKATEFFLPSIWFAVALLNNSYTYHHFLPVALCSFSYAVICWVESFFVASVYFDFPDTTKLQLYDTVNITAFRAFISDVGDIAVSSWLIPTVQGLETELPMSEVSGYSWVNINVWSQKQTCKYKPWSQQCSAILWEITCKNTFAPLSHP